MRSDLIDILGQMARLVAFAQARLSRYVDVVDAARAIVDNVGGCASGGWREGAAFLRLAAALDTLDKEG